MPVSAVLTVFFPTSLLSYGSTVAGTSVPIHAHEGNWAEMLSYCRLRLSCLMVVSFLIDRVCVVALSEEFCPIPFIGAFAHTVHLFDRSMIPVGAHWTTGAYNYLMLSKWIGVRK